MDEQARRYYDYITNGLKAESPEGIFTRDQIDQATVFLWGNALTDFHHQCEAELERVEMTISDPDERVRTAENINEYYAEKEVAFGHNHDVAVREIYRENGIPFEDYTLDNRELEQQVKVYTIERGEEQRNLSEHALGRAEFAKRTSELPERTDGEKSRDDEQRGRQTDDQQRGDLIPKQQLIPPREFTQRHSQNMTRDEFVAKLRAKDTADRTPPERDLNGRTHDLGYDR